jgi:iron complex outermembrane receptor protein
MIKKFSIFCLAIALSLTAVKAQSQADTLNAEVLEAATIKAVRAAENAPVSQVTVTKKEIDAVYQGQDGAFLLEQISPSIVSASESGTSLGNYGTFRLRGIDQSRVNLTLNGVPLNDMLGQGVFFSNFVDFGNSIESVQIQRGVGTSTNGVSSYAGSINFESVSLANAKAYSEVQLTGGSFNTLRGSAEVSTGLLENRTAFYARLSHIQSDGFRDNTGTNAQSFFFSGGYFGEKHALKFTAFGGLANNELGYFAVPLSLIEEDPRTSLNYLGDEDDFNQYMLQAQHTYRVATNTSLVSTAYYSGAGGDFFASYPLDSVTFVQENYPLFNRHYGLMSSINHTAANGKLKLSAGVHAYQFLRENIQYEVPELNSTYSYNENSFKNEVSAFAKAQYQLNKWELYADVQVRALQMGFSTNAASIGQEVAIPNREFFFVNPKAGITYQVNAKNQLYASFGRSGREATRVDIFGGFNLIDTNSLNLALNTNTPKPEYVNDVELGYRYRGQKLSLAVNGFFMAFENEIAPIGEALAFGVLARLNQAPSYRTGVELNANWKITEKLSLQSQSTFMRSVIESYSPADTNLTFENVTPLLSPDWNVRATLSYELFKDLRVSVTARYLSESFLELTNNPDLTVPESLIFNAAINYQFYKQHTLALQFNNLTDELYFTRGQVSFGQAAYYVQPPFHIYGTLTLRF